MTLISGNLFDGAQDDYRVIKVTTANTATTDDTIEVDLSKFGSTGVEGIVGFHHSTEDSIVIQEQPTTVVSAGVLTITVGGTAATGKKVYLVNLS